MPKRDVAVEEMNVKQPEFVIARSIWEAERICKEKKLKIVWIKGFGLEKKYVLAPEEVSEKEIQKFVAKL